MKLGLACLAAMLVAAPPALAALSTAEWRADLAAMASALRTVHRDPYRRVSRDSLEAEVRRLDARLGTLEPGAAILEMARIAALLGDGHTRLALPEGDGWRTDYAHLGTPAPRDSTLVFHHLPVRLWSYDDGLGIEGVLPGHERLLGARLVRIGGVPADTALARMRRFVSVDNDLGWRFLGAARLTCIEALRAAGVIGAGGPVTLDLVTRSGREESVALAPVPAASTPRWVPIASLHGSARFADRHPEADWWFERAPRGNALYVQVRRIADGERERLVDFAGRLGREVARVRPERVIVDLRSNTGGDGQLVVPLVRALAADPAVNRHGGLYVLTGRRTFSAAQTLVNLLEHLTEALFVGEPTGTSPSFYGDNRRVVLPNSGLTLRVSTVYWRDWTGSEGRKATMPDLPVPFRIADDLGGGDPALDAAFDYQPAATLADQVEQLRARGGTNAATRRVFRALWDPRFSRAECDSAAASLARPAR